jgi:hypothetical protein
MGQDLAIFTTYTKKMVIYQFDRYIKRGREIYICKVVAAYLIIISTN